MTPKHYMVVSRRGRTHPLLWCAAIICTILAVAVIAAGIAVFSGYMAIHPRIPFLSIISATLDAFRYNQAGLLVTQVSIVVRAENDNLKAHASFQNTSLILSFGGMEMAYLVSGRFNVVKNSSRDFHYVVQSEPVPLDPERMELASTSLRRGEVVFGLRGNSRAQWHVGPLGSVKYWCHLDCQLHFHLQRGTFSNSHRCSSRSK